VSGLAPGTGAGRLELGLELVIGSPYLAAAYVEHSKDAADRLEARFFDGLDHTPIQDRLEAFDARV